MRLPITIMLPLIFLFVSPGSSWAGKEDLPEFRAVSDESPSPSPSAEPFPTGDLFQPPLASPKEPRTHATWVHLNIAGERINLGSVGFGENFGFFRWRDALGNSWQFGLSGAVFAQFNLDASSADLINADYTIGMPFSYRHGPWSGRARFYHQSSHLGDEYLLNPQQYQAEHRVDISFEAAELLAGWEWERFRISGGPSYILRTSTPLGRWSLQGGIDYEGKNFWRDTTHFFCSALLHSWEETSWNPDLSLKTGINISNPSAEQRAVQLYAEYFYGNLPFGQFYTLRGDYYGMGIRFRY